MEAERRRRQQELDTKYVQDLVYFRKKRLIDYM